EEEAGEDSQENLSIDFEELVSQYTNPSKGNGVKGKKKASASSSKSQSTGRGSAKKAVEIGPSGMPYTPLELQVLELKRNNPGTLLMFEVGYKMKFYGEDAQLAAKHLAIVCYPKRNFHQASIPVHRLEVHLKKLLSQGLKVGIVEQTETAALKKAGDNRNDVFGRKMTRLYTAATYVDQLDSVDALDPMSVPPLTCLVESPSGGLGTDEKVKVSLISVCASTGDVMWDHFEGKLVHIAPAELLLPDTGLSGPTEKMLKHFVIHSHTEYKIRTERFKSVMAYTDAFNYVTHFYSDDHQAENIRASQSFKSGQLIATIASFPKDVVVALAHLVKYLSTFDVADALLETQFFSRFTERTHMLLNGNTLTNLEIYRNETDFTKKGSLLWVLDHATTKFGTRMLKDWIGRPLTDKIVLTARTDAIDEILTTPSPSLTVLRQALRGLPDLARGLCRIQYGKCTPQELALLLSAFNKLGTAFDRLPANTAAFDSSLLNDIVAALPRLREPMQSLLGAVNLKMAKEGRKDAMWTDLNKYPDLDEIMMGIEVTESELKDELGKVRKELRRPALQYSTVAGEEYLLEIRKADLPEVPPDWRLISSTRTVRRLRTPGIITKLEERAQLKEALEESANRAYRSFLGEISQNHYAVLRDAVNKLAVADCLCSLALVAVQEGYVRPEFVNDRDEAQGGRTPLEIVEGRHPMIEKLRDEPFVPNTVCMHPQGHKVITGPNMGGKSSVVRMIALCAIMAQIGSYVPAESMKLGMLDGILIRMGASDELARGRSTFMVELQETSDIMQLASARSLVILDELGRGTSTFDGMAIASAVLQHLIENVKCKTLFITHYPEVALDLARRFPNDVQNMHMSYTEDTRIDGTRQVTFLYRLSDGLAENSFGVECARLAGVAENILQKAQAQALTMETLISERKRRNR
ncbi:hypothetical protein PHLGIDRAFT_510551, partial [Phlebiopsis gigantea 11061_1 CR5-6]